MVVAGIAFLIVVPVDNPEASADRASLTARLTRAAARVQDVALHGGLPLAQPLASQLHVADPAVRYQSASTFTTLPDVPGTITVYRGGDEVWLWGRAADNSVLGMDINVAARTATLTQPPSASANLLVNGDLEPPIVRPWQISESRNAAIRSDVTASSASNASLLLVGKRHRSKHGGAFVTQIVRKLPERSPGTRFTFRIQVLSADLSRELPIAMALRYTDGTSQFATATRGTSGRPQPGVSAVPPNTNGTWQTVTATTVAKKHVRAVQVFLFDTGTQPLSGAAGFDAASLVVGPRLAAFPPPR